MEITIEELCKMLEERLLLCSGLTEFYIGETDNMDETIGRHKLEGFHSTQLLAVASHSIIKSAEEFMIAYFNNSIIKEKFRNKGNYSVGSKKANKIYVSIKICATCIEELDDDDINWPKVFKLK